MERERIGKIKFSAKDKKAHFCVHNDDTSIMFEANGEPMVYSAKKLGGGGTAKVFKIPAGAFPIPIAIKRYNDKILSDNGSAIGSYLRSLIEFKKNLPDDMRRIIDNVALWAQRLVYDYDSDKVCGFTMQLIPDLFFTKIKVAGEEETKESNLDFILHGADFRRKHGLPTLTAKGRAKIIYDFIKIVSVLHSHDYVLGDLSPKNMLIAVDTNDQGKNRILFIDTDSYRKKGSIHPLKQLHTPDWIPPECQKASAELGKLTPNANPNLIARLEIDMFIQNQCTDIYKVCLAITRLYHEGDHASIITASDSADRKLRKDIGDDFADHVLLGLSENPNDRPNISAMLTCFRNAMLVKQKKGSK
jgi:serine/threonine protein kinase